MYAPPSRSESVSSSASFPAAMHSVARGESRHRRSSNLETHSRNPTPSSSILFLLSFLHTIAYHAAASHASLPPVLLSLPALLFPPVVFLILSRFSTLRPTFRRIRHVLPTLACLQAASILSTLIAVRLLGPLRSLLASFANAAVFSALRNRRLSIFRACSIALALYLLVYDAMGRTNPAVLVRDSVLKNPTANVMRTRLHTTGHAYAASLKHTWRSLANHNSLRRSRNLTTNHELPDPPPDKLHSRGLLSIREQTAQTKSDSVQVDQPPPIPQSRHQNQALKSVDARNHGPRMQIHTDRQTLLKQDPQQVSNESVIALSSSLRTAKDSSDSRFAPYQIPSSAVSSIVGVVLAVFAPIAFRTATDMTSQIIYELGYWPTVTALVYISSAAFVLPIFLACFLTSVAYHKLHVMYFFSHVVPNGLIIAVCLIIIPVLLCYRHHSLENVFLDSQRLSKSSVPRSISLMKLCIRASRSSDPSVGQPTRFYCFILISIYIVRLISQQTFGYIDSLTFSSSAATAILIFQSLPAFSIRDDANQGRRGTYNHSRSQLSTFLSRSTPLFETRNLWTVVLQVFPRSLRIIRDFAKHARSNKASWQVLNFLILQIGMAVVELIYAAITKSTGLFSISADNFFCSIAVGVGLYAIRVSSGKPSISFTYGYSRAESLCGFVNGVMLIYVALLIVLESFERHQSDDEVEITRAFSVCLFGIIGNVLGLYFFPPETRRENHNVQGIYLHIWANTLAFSSMAISTAITASVSDWKVVDLLTSVIVALSVIVLAIPLLMRSARLLLLVLPVEKQEELKAAQNHLRQIAGVVNVTALRLWNLTPNHLVASVKLEVSSKYGGDTEDILSRARFVFAEMGVPASQCTVQITRVDNVQSDFVIKMSTTTGSSVDELTRNPDQLQISYSQKRQARKSTSSKTLNSLNV